MAGEEIILAAVLAIILVLVILRAGIKGVREYERLVIFRLGRLFPTPKGPGLTVIIPIFHRRVLIHLRTVAFDLPRRDVSLPDTMVRAIAKQAEAERERRPRVIMAEGEFQAAEKMREAAMLYGSAPSAMRLRELQTLTEIAREKNMIVVTNTTAAGDITGEVASLTAALARKGDKKE